MRRLALLLAVAACDFPDKPPCALALSYAPLFDGATESAVDLGTSTGFVDEIEWVGIVAGSGSSQVTLTLLAASGRGSDTPTWPSGIITPASGIDIATDGGVEVFLELGTDVSGPFEIAVAGTVNIASVRPDLTGNATGLTFQHYDVDGSGNVICVDPDMCTSSIAAFNFDAPLQAQ